MIITGLSCLFRIFTRDYAILILSASATHQQILKLISAPSTFRNPAQGSRIEGLGFRVKYKTSTKSEVSLKKQLQQNIQNHFATHTSRGLRVLLRSNQGLG